MVWIICSNLHRGLWQISFWSLCSEWRRWWCWTFFRHINTLWQWWYAIVGQWTEHSGFAYASKKTQFFRLLPKYTTLFDKLQHFCCLLVYFAMSRIIRSHIFVVNWPLFGEAWIWFRVSRITFWRHCLRKCFRFCRIEHCYCSSHTDSVGKKPDLSYFREIISRNFSRNWFLEIIYVWTRTFALHLNIIASLIMFLICTLAEIITP